MANPNPSPATRFQPGNNANPGGKTKEQKQKEIEAAEMATDMRLAMLSAMTERIEAGEDPLTLMNAATLKLFKDSEDRAHGTPQQHVDMTSEGSAIDALREAIKAGGKRIGNL